MKKTAIFIVIIFLLNISPLSILALDNTDYSLKNIMLMEMPKGSNGGEMVISWKNPNVSNIEKISLFDITNKGDKILVHDEFSTNANSYVSYAIKNLVHDELYRYKLEADCGDKTLEYTLQGRPKTGNNAGYIGASASNWKTAYGRKDVSSYYPQTGYIVTDEFAGEGNYSVKMFNNTFEYINGNYSNLQYNISGLKTNCSYKLTFLYKTGAGGAAVVRTNSYKMGELPANKKTFTQAEYSFENTALKPVSSIEIQLTKYTEGVYVDNFELYELDLAGNKVGANLIKDGSFEFVPYTENVSDISDVSYDEGSYLSFSAPQDTKYINIYAKENDRYILKAVANQTSSMKHSVYVGGLENDKENTLKITCVSTGMMESSGIEYIVQPVSSEPLYEKIDLAKGYVKEIKTLINQCSEKGIATDYEIVDFSVMERFCEYMSEDFVKYDAYERALGYYDCIYELYTNTQNKLLSYLNGSAVPKSVVRYSGKEIENSGIGCFSQAVKEGQEKTLPLFFGGYGHFDTAVDDFDNFEAFGANTGTVSIKMYDVVTERFEAADWNLYTNFKVACDFKAKLTEEDAHSGKTSVKITRTTEPKLGSVAYIRQTVAAKPMTTYVFGLWAKGTNVNGVHFSGNPLINSDYGLSNRTRHYINGSCDWKNFEYTYTTSENEYTMEIMIPVEGKVDSLFIDDVYIKESGQDENLLLNPGFENGTKEGSSEFDIYEPYISEAIRNMKRAKAANLFVNAGLGIHHMPQFMYNNYPDLRDEDGIYTSYMPFNPTHPQVLKIIAAFLEAVIPKISEAKCADDVCFLNEPSFQAYNTNYYNPLWKENLKKIYDNNISRLNSVCKTSYNSFEEIEIGEIEKNTVLYKHLCDYNTSIMTELVEFISTKIKSLSPDMKIYAKLLPLIRAYGDKTLAYGTDYEKLNKFVDINGCDASTFYNSSETPLLTKMAWYDFLTSIKDAPVFNSEDHMIQDNKGIDKNIQTEYYALADIWQGAVHGRAQSIAWLWDRSEKSITSSFMNSNILLRPELASKYGKKFLDLNRLSNEISILQRSERKVAILYSQNSYVYEPTYMESLYEAYKNTVFCGIKPVFITESTADKLDNYDFLIVPMVLSAQDDTIAAIHRLIKRGGRVIFIGEDCLLNNEFMQTRTDSATNEIRSNAVVAGENIKETLRTEFDKADLSDIKLRYTDNTHAENIEITSGKQNGYRYVNLCNYTWTQQTVNIYCNENKVSDMYELIGGKEIDTDIVLEPYTPVLIRFTEDLKTQLTAERIYYEGDNKIIADTNPLSTGNGNLEIKAISDKEAEIYIAFYKNGILTDIQRNATVNTENGINILSSVINLSGMEDCEMKAFLWTKTGMWPLSECVELSGSADTILTDASVYNGSMNIKGYAYGSSRVAISVYSNNELVYLDEILSGGNGAFRVQFSLPNDVGADLKINIRAIGKDIFMHTAYAE